MEVTHLGVSSSFHTSVRLLEWSRQRKSRSKVGLRRGPLQREKWRKNQGGAPSRQRLLLLLDSSEILEENEAECSPKWAEGCSWRSSAPISWLERQDKQTSNHKDNTQGIMTISWAIIQFLWKMWAWKIQSCCQIGKKESTGDKRLFRTEKTS